MDSVCGLSAPLDTQGRVTGEVGENDWMTGDRGHDLGLNPRCRKNM